MKKISDGSSLPDSETRRRANVQALKGFARLYIGDKKVSETKKFPLIWPKFEIEICEMF